MIDFDWYRSFVAIYQIGTVTGAAEARFLTQPAVTQHLAALEAAVGTALFIRTSRRMQPTQQGKALYTQVVQALEKLEQVSQELRRQATPEQPLIRLGTPLEYFYEKALSQLAEAPFRLWVQFGVAQSLVEELERGELDVVIATQRIAVRDLEYKKLVVHHVNFAGLNGWIQPLQFDPGISASKPPINRVLLSIALFFPSLHLLPQGCDVR